MLCGQFADARFNGLRNHEVKRLDRRGVQSAHGTFLCIIEKALLLGPKRPGSQRVKYLHPLRRFSGEPCVQY